MRGLTIGTTGFRLISSNQRKRIFRLSHRRLTQDIRHYAKEKSFAHWVDFVRELSLLLLTSLSAYAQQKGDFAGLVEIGDGRKMFLECRGSGSPTVILESGYRDSADNWSTPLEPGKNTVFPQVAKFTRVCAYDCPGTARDANHLSRSTQVPMPRIARDVVSDLHALLQTAPVPGPYVFAAHSLGGIFARLYASTYPNEVVGMVLMRYPKK